MAKPASLSKAWLLQFQALLTICLDISVGDYIKYINIYELFETLTLNEQRAVTH